MVSCIYRTGKGFFGTGKNEFQGQTGVLAGTKILWIELRQELEWQKMQKQIYLLTWEYFLEEEVIDRDRSCQ